MRAAAAKGEKSRRLLLDSPEGVVGRDANRQIDGSAVAGVEEPLYIRFVAQRRLQQTFLRRQREHRIRHATTLDPRAPHLRHHVAQPARVDSATRSENSSFESQGSRQSFVLLSVGIFLSVSTFSAAQTRR